MAYVNSVTLSGGRFISRKYLGKGLKGEESYLAIYRLGSVEYVILVYDRKDQFEDFESFNATIYGSLTSHHEITVVKAHTIVEYF